MIGPTLIVSITGLTSRVSMIELTARVSMIGLISNVSLIGLRSTLVPESEIPYNFNDISKMYSNIAVLVKIR